MAGNFIRVTDAGRAALVAQGNTGTNEHRVTEIGLCTGAFVFDPAMTVMPNERKRVKTFGGKNVAKDTIHVTIQDTTNDQYSLYGYGLYLESGVLVAVYVQSTPIMEKSPAAYLMLASDMQFVSIDAAKLVFGDASFLNPPASETVQGVIELATQEEVNAGKDSLRAITPKTAAAWYAPLLRPKLTGPASVTSAPTDQDAQLSVAAASGALNRDAKIRFLGTFAAGTADTNARLIASIRAGFDGGSWGKEYLDFYLNSSINDAQSDARMARVMRLTYGGRVLIGQERDDGASALRIANPTAGHGLVVARPNSAQYIAIGAASGLDPNATYDNKIVSYSSPGAAKPLYIHATTDEAGSVPTNGSVGIQFKVLNGTAARIWQSGNVGIGAVTDDSKNALQVGGSIRASNYYLLQQGASDSGVFGFGNANGPSIAAYGSGTSGSGALVFRTAGAERARFTADGRLIVGATAGDESSIAYFRGTVGIAGSLVMSARNAGIELGSVSAAGTPFIDFHSSGSNVDHDARILASGGDGTTNDTGTLQYYAATHRFFAGGANRLTINSAGCVLVGSGSGNGTDLLQVNGSGTFASNVTTAKSGGGFTSNDPAGTVHSNLYFQKAGVTQWGIRGDWANGGLFEINRYTSSGTYKDGPFTIDYATGAVRMPNRVLIGGPADDGSTRMQVAGSARFAGEVLSTSNNAFRAVSGDYGVFIRNDGGSVYFMQTAAKDQYGSFNSYRPFSWNLGSGAVTIDATGAGTSFNGSVTANKALTVGGAATLNSALTVKGDTTLTGNASVSKALTVTGATTLSSTLGVTGDVTVSGKLSVAKSLTVSGDTAVATGSGNLMVGGPTYAGGTNATIAKDGNIWGTQWGGQWLRTFLDNTFVHKSGDTMTGDLRAKQPNNSNAAGFIAARADGTTQAWWHGSMSSGGAYGYSAWSTANPDGSWRANVITVWGEDNRVEIQNIRGKGVSYFNDRIVLDRPGWQADIGLHNNRAGKDSWSYIRAADDGGVEFINNAYNAVTFRVDDWGNVYMRGARILQPDGNLNLTWRGRLLSAEIDDIWGNINTRASAGARVQWDGGINNFGTVDRLNGALPAPWVICGLGGPGNGTANAITVLGVLLRNQ
ncbi:phage tail fiber protein [Burkholderia territorii]|uniref:phage tail fiber protein n=1 Tax=Burkholderia territorii TaxID=1503055 RepID=UPI0021C36C4E|nr:phage tail protein [Burkholderia territorii]